MEIKTFIIDTFTSKPFHGNPTSVCIYEHNVDKSKMQSLATELNFPVTAFIKKIRKESENYNIFYFTPTTEISACGHATLASAKVVFELQNIQTCQFITTNNIEIQASQKGNLVVMDYPKYELEICQVEQELLSSLHLTEYKYAGYCSQLETLFIELENPKKLREILPDYNKLVASNSVIKEVVITSRSDNPNYDFLLRSFCPWIGIDEDPVTGSVHSVLAGYWKSRLNKSQLKAYQASARGGEVYVNALPNKVELGGQSVTLLKGEITL